ncbi:dCTP deaminase [Fuerstiella marisgermanici]|uniref:Deoxycytidine triphosphate deaminase n=1 Tax=Fuerstiella marisgermanici TaxID=1891926 RepID=A0A1P8WK34_9PLAN|nr:hypothetical protein [Fuerstiella marisgermanici]APZ94398.1 Deoxycytidine triphosphate deaminase [Fuerstiella marisgermanici]
MFLNAEQITAKRSESALLIEPFDRELLKPVSYVLRLGHKVRRWAKSDKAIDVWSNNCSESVLGPIETFSEITVNRGELLLVNSHERIGLTDGLLGVITTLSHISRFGISVTSDSHLVSPGFGKDASCELTFEITSHNPNPVRLRAGLPICHLLLANVEAASGKTRLANSVYESLPTPFGPALFEEFASISIFQSASEQRKK